MSVRVAVFGTSRSGKDYTIRDAAEILAEEGALFTHISPIGMVHEELGGRRLRDMTESEKLGIVSDVRGRMEAILQDDYVFVDEHYCFPETFGGRRIDNGYYGEKLPYRPEKGDDGRTYEVVFRGEWLEKYDMAVYMDIDPCVILDRFRTSEGDKNNPYATFDDVRLWQVFEMDRVGGLCDEYGIPMYYVYDHRKSGEELAAVVDHHMRGGNAGTESIIRNSIRK